MSVTLDYDIICLSGTFLDSSISDYDERININGYNLLRAVHPSNKKEEVFVCIVRKTFLLLKEMIYVP